MPSTVRALLSAKVKTISAPSVVQCLLFIPLVTLPAVFLFQRIPQTEEFMPHGFCYLWDSRLIWLHVVSDTIIFLSYVSIPFTLLYISRRRRDIPFNWMVLCFGIFIVACGLTHAMEVWNLWHANYWLAGIVKAITAAASLITAILLVRLVPQALALPSMALLQAEIANREKAEARFRGLLEAAPDAIIVADDRGHITLANAQTAAIFGYRGEELLGQRIELLIPESLRKKHVVHRMNYTALPRVRAMGEGYELHGLRKDGTEFPVEISLSPLQIQGETLVLSAIRDVTPRKEREAAIRRLNEELARRNADLIAINQELESFSYSVSHDLRAPLRAIDGFSLALLEDCGAGLPQQGKADLERIRAAATRMAQLIDDMLRLARIARSEMHFDTVDLSALVREVARDLQASEPARDAKISIIPEMKVKGDRQLLRVMMENLIGNAWKFTSKQPKTHIEVGMEAKNSENVFFVRDNGSGFDMRYADKLFGVFQRLHTDREYAGTGVGLATVQRIVLRHGGRIWAESALGKGATFYFALDAHRTVAAAN